MGVSLLLVVLGLQAQDPVHVAARLTDTEIEVGQTTVLRVEVETDGARAQIQPITMLPPGMELVGTRNWDQRQFSMPGGGRRFISREFSLRVNEPGRYRIPAVDVIVDGRVHSTEPALLTVIPVAAGPAASPLGDDGVVLRAWLDVDTVHVGQQVTLHVEAMFSREARLQLRRAPEYEAPAPSGFWVHEIPGSPAPATGGIRGEVYETQLFRRALFPVSPGTYEIPPARIFYEIRRGILHAPETFEVASRALPLVVLPVPESGRPPGFTGAVGRFTITAGLEPERVAAGDATVLSVEIEGAGNIKALPPPRLPELPGVDVFPPSEEADFETRGTLVHGRKRFTWVLVPRERGELVVPAIRYPFYDPEAGSFEIATAPPLPLTVDPGDVVADDREQPVARYLKTTSAPDRLAWVASPWFAAVQAVPLLLLAGALLRRRRRADRRPSGRSLSRRRRELIRDLEAGATAGDAGFFADAGTAVRSWVGARLDLDPKVADDSDMVAAAGVPVVVATALRDALDRCAAARYAPVAPGQAARVALVRDLAGLLEHIDRKAPRAGAEGGPGRGSAGRATPAGAALLLVLIASGHGAAQDDRGPFVEGVRLFDSARYEEAAQRFREHVRSHPADAAGWYNLATAHYQAGQQGHAVQGWLRATRLDPRDGDTRHNLRAAGTEPELVRRATPVLPLRLREMLLMAAVAWFATGVLGAWWMLRGRRAARVTAVATFFLAIGLGVTAWHSMRGPDTIVMLEPAPLRAGPNLHAEPLTMLEAGTGLVPIDRRGEWVRARTLRGQEGWLEAGQAGGVRGPE